MHHRSVVRDDHKGLYKIVAAIDYVMFGSSEQPCHQPESNGATPLTQLICRETVYIVNITSDSAVLLSDMLKTIFNITLNWCDKEKLDEVSVFNLKCSYLLMHYICCRKNYMCVNVLFIS